MNLSIDDFTWIHPEYEREVRDSFMSESEVEANAIVDSENQPLTSDNFEKVRQIKRK